MSSVEKDGSYITVATALSGTSETPVYTAPDSYTTKVTCIRVAHNAGTAGTARIVAVLGGTAYCIVHNAVVPANSALEIEMLPLVLKPGEEIRVTGASGQHVIVSGLAETRRAT